MIHKNCWQLAIVKIISFQDSLLTSYDSVVELNAQSSQKNGKYTFLRLPTKLAFFALFFSNFGAM